MTFQIDLTEMHEKKGESMKFTRVTSIVLMPTILFSTIAFTADCNKKNPDGKGVSNVIVNGS